MLKPQGSRWGAWKMTGKARASGLREVVAALSHARLASIAATVAGLAVLLTLRDPGLTVDEPLDVRPGRTYVATLQASGWRFFQPGVVERVFRDNAEHPPLGRWLLGLASTLGESFQIMFLGPDPTGLYVLSGRLAPALVFALLVGVVVADSSRRWGHASGIAAGWSLLVMPRVFAHAHLAALDTFLSIFWTLGLLAGARATAPAASTRLDHRGGRTLVARPADKDPRLVALTDPGGLGIHEVAVAKSGQDPAGLEPDRCGAVPRGLALALVRHLDTLDIVLGNVDAACHDPGRVLRPDPGGSRSTLALPVGLFCGHRADRSSVARSSAGSPRAGGIAAWITSPGCWPRPILLFLGLFSTRVPVYDGERLFLHVFPAWAMLIGLGFGRLWQRLGKLRAARYALALLLVAQCYG